MQPDDTGCIDYNEFVRAVKDDSYLLDHGRFFNNVFKYLDEDRDGLISYAEYKRIAEINPGEPINQEELKYSFNFIDSDKDGKISFHGNSIHCLKNHVHVLFFLLFLEFLDFMMGKD